MRSGRLDTRAASNLRLMPMPLLHTVRSLRLGTIRSRLFVAFVLVTLLPALAFGAVSTMVGYRSGRQQVINQLESVATIKEAELHTWVSNLETDLQLALIGADTMSYLRDVLSPTPDDARYQIGSDRLHARFGQMVARSPRLDELFLMDLDRRVVLCTDPGREGGIGAPGSYVYFREGLKGPYLYPPSYMLTQGGIAIIAVRPVLDREGQALGILAARAGPAALSDIMLERTGLGRTGETYLVTQSYIMLTEPRFGEQRWSYLNYVFSKGASEALAGHVSGRGSYENYRHERVIGVYRWLPELQVALLAEQSEAEAMSGVYATLGANLSVAVLSVLVAGTLSLLLARSIVIALNELAETAQRVAGGELDHSAKVTRADEIGAVAQAFNTMTDRLRQMIDTLEERVRERTEALQRRALQLETSAKVSREITSILDIDALLRQVVELIKGAFGYYYVCIFLVDEERNELVLGAGTGQVGEHWREEGLRFTIGGGSLNGQAAEANAPMFANDVSRDERYRGEELLPWTRSELVVPLGIGRQVIGTLDVQSSHVNGFIEDDIRLLQSLGDQIAVAIENARLYERSQRLAVVEERQRLARELHDSLTQLLYSTTLFAEAARREIGVGDMKLVEDYLDQLSDMSEQALRQMRLLVFELRPPALDREGLVGALQQRLRAVEERVGIETELVVDSEIELPSIVEEGLFRIVQEALNNALRHAEATSVTVRIRVDATNVLLEVADNGNGFDSGATSERGGMGLVFMRERAESLGGQLDIRSAPGEGTTLMVGVEVRQ